VPKIFPRLQFGLFLSLHTWIADLRASACHECREGVRLDSEASPCRLLSLLGCHPAHPSSTKSLCFSICRHVGSFLPTYPCSYLKSWSATVLRALCILEALETRTIRKSANFFFLHPCPPGPLALYGRTSLACSCEPCWFFQAEVADNLIGRQFCTEFDARVWLEEEQASWNDPETSQQTLAPRISALGVLFEISVFAKTVNNAQCVVAAESFRYESWYRLALPCWPITPFYMHYASFPTCALKSSTGGGLSVSASTCTPTQPALIHSSTHPARWDCTYPHPSLGRHCWLEIEVQEYLSSSSTVLEPRRLVEEMPAISITVRLPQLLRTHSLWMNLCSVFQSPRYG